MDDKLYVSYASSDMNIESDNKSNLLKIACDYNRTIHFIDADIVKEKFGVIAPLLGIEGYCKWKMAASGCCSGGSRSNLVYRQ